jgi:hypothetical protein
MLRANLGGTLGFAGHLLSPTVSEASREGRPTIILDQSVHHYRSTQTAHTTCLAGWSRRGYNINVHVVVSSYRRPIQPAQQGGHVRDTIFPTYMFKR